MTENALRVVLHQLRKDFRDVLLREVMETHDDGEDARAEIRHLVGLFEQRSSLRRYFRTLVPLLMASWVQAFPPAPYYTLYEWCVIRWARR